MTAKFKGGKIKRYLHGNNKTCSPARSGGGRKSFLVWAQFAEIGKTEGWPCVLVIHHCATSYPQNLAA